MCLCDFVPTKGRDENFLDKENSNILDYLGKIIITNYKNYKIYLLPKILPFYYLLLTFYGSKLEVN